MAVTLNKDPKALARELNKFVTDAGGKEIPGLDNLDPKELIQIRDGLRQFLDNFDQAGQKDPQLAKLADTAAVKSLRQLAQIASQKVDQAAVANTAQTQQGLAANKKLSADDVAAGNQDIANLQAQVAQQKLAVSQQKVQLQGEVQKLEANPNRTPAEEALLAGKRTQLQVLGGIDQNLDVKKQGLEAAQLALSDGVLTGSEAKDLQTIQRAVLQKDQMLGQLGAQADQLVGHAQALSAAPYAQNGSNFDPMALNQVATSAILASAMQANGLPGITAPGSNSLQNLQNLIGNAGGFANTGVANTAQNFQRAGALSTPSRIGDDASLGTDANLASLTAAGGGGGFFEDRVFAIMCKVVEDFQKQIEQRLEKLQQQAQDAESGGGKGGGGKGGGLGGIIGGVAGTALGGPVGGMVGKAVGGAVGGAVDGGGKGGAGGASGGNGQESRNIEFEKIKYDMQKLSQMQQAMSNILNTMDDLAKNAIRHIKAG